MGKYTNYIILTIFIVFLGDILYLSTGSALLSNWGPVIITAIIVGFRLAKSNDSHESTRRKSLQISLYGGILKLVLSIVKVKGLTMLAAILIPLIYSLIIYLFILISIRGFKLKQ
ncbi:hypothetical protein [Fusibacter sp. 3D3]|uniref:hypothetical protein n=1 Tax=Fusibacter sp. 3D3 TaxID=1048380 RepID=UPI0008533F8A|nr:hypothetical protein [Fusibacter sp. 3D3]